MNLIYRVICRLHFWLLQKKPHFFIDIICTHLPLLKAMRCNFSCTKGSKGRCNRRFPLCLNRVLYKLLKMLKIADNPIFSPKMHFSICKTSQGKFTLIKSYDRKTYHQERGKTFLPEKFKWAPFFLLFSSFFISLQKCYCILKCLSKSSYKMGNRCDCHNGQLSKYQAH